MARKARQECNRHSPAGRARLIALGMAIIFTGCAYQSPGAKVSTVINVSIMPPASVVPTL